MPDVKTPYVRKHVHRWKLTLKQTAKITFIGTSRPATLKRECEDCGVKQSAEPTAQQWADLIPGYENIADVDWK